MLENCRSLEHSELPASVEHLHRDFATVPGEELAECVTLSSKSHKSSETRALAALLATGLRMPMLLGSALVVEIF